MPHRHSLHKRGVSNDVEAVSRPAAGHVDPINGLHESDFASTIAANRAENHNLGLFTLEIVDGSKPQHVANVYVNSSTCSHIFGSYEPVLTEGFAILLA